MIGTSWPTKRTTGSPARVDRDADRGRLARRAAESLTDATAPAWGMCLRPRSPWSSGQGDGFDLDQQLGSGELRLDARARRERLGDELDVRLVHFCELADVGDEDRRLDQLVHPAAGRFERAPHVLQHLAGLG